MKKIIFLNIAILISTIAVAHNGAINGKITNLSSKQWIENAIISIDSLSNITYSKEDGLFTIKDVKPGKYVMQVSHFSFETKMVEVEVSDYNTTNINVVLQPKPFSLKEIKISSNQGITKNIINKINVDRIPINSTQDMLRVVPGLMIAQHAGGGKSEQIFLRGFDCDHGTDIAIGVDGMPVNMVSHAHGQGYADLHFVIPEMVEQVQVNKGGYQASVGDFSTAGNIQFVTKKYLPTNTVILEKGNYNNNRVVAMINILPRKIQEKQNLFIAGEYLFNKGFFESAMNLNRLNFLSKYNLQLNTKNSISLQATYFNSFWNASGQIPERVINDKTITRFGSIDNTEGGLTSRFNASAEMKNILKNNAILKQQLFYNRYQFELFSNFTFFKNDTVNGDMIKQKEARDIVGYNGSYQLDHKISGIELVTTFGLQARYDHAIGSELSNVKQQKIFIKPISLGDIDQLNTAIYFDENIAISKKFKVNLGLRYDIFGFSYLNKLNSNFLRETEMKGNISPKANAFYTLHKNAQIFAMFGKSFHSNDTRVVVQQNGQQILPSSLGSEIGMILKPFKNAIITASLWQLDLQQEFVYVGDESVVEASGATKRLGMDLGIRYQITKNITADIDANYAFARSKDEPSDANRIPLAPNFTSIGGLMYKANNGVLASLRYRHLADRADNETNTLIAQGYTILDAVFKYPYKKMQFGLQAENLLNTKWKEAQFETETRLKNEKEPVSEIHFTSGTPFSIKASISINF